MDKMKMDKKTKPDYHGALLDIEFFLKRETQQLHERFLNAKKYLNKHNDSNDGYRLYCIYCAHAVMTCNCLREEIGETVRARGIPWFSEEFIREQCVEIDNNELLQIMRI